MRSRWYAEVPAVRTRQLAADAGWVLATVVGILAGRAVFHAVDAVASPVHDLADGADRLRSDLEQAGAVAADVPLAGRALAAPLTGAADGAASLAASASTQADSLSHIALAAGLAAALVVVALATWRWVRWRRRGWARERVARSWSQRAGGEDWLALQALHTVDPERLSSLPGDPVDGWRRRDPVVVRALADLHLERVGVRRG